MTQARVDWHLIIFPEPEALKLHFILPLVAPPGGRVHVTVRIAHSAHCAIFLSHSHCLLLVVQAQGEGVMRTRIRSRNEKHFNAHKNILILHQSSNFRKLKIISQKKCVKASLLEQRNFEKSPLRRCAVCVRIWTFPPGIMSFYHEAHCWLSCLSKWSFRQSVNGVFFIASFCLCFETILSL